MSSILNDVKHTLGLLPEDKAFDIDILMHINTVIFSLQQLGIIPMDPIEILSDAEEWDFLFPDASRNAIKSYLFLRVKLLFDPPGTGFVLASQERQITELEWRMSVEMDRP